MESTADQVRAFALAVLFHLALILLLWLGGILDFSRKDTTAAGEPIQATLQASAADIRRAQAAIKASPKPQKPAPIESSPPPQPIPEPKPQTSDTPLQMTPQAPQDQPDTVDQERISKLAEQQAEKRALEEQEERRRQEQVDLTQDILRQQIAERRQRLREFEQAKLATEAAAKRTRMEEQKLQQLADLQSAAPKPATRTPPTPTAGDRGIDPSLLARYKAAMNQTARENWNPIGAPELSHCRVRFKQIVGGEVIDVEFIDCPYDAEGREFVERALRKTPMPYSGFESVFKDRVELDFCHPFEDCQ
jgi:colicin import membrane protein